MNTIESISREPIMEFESIEQAYQCMKEWKEILYLNDWITKLVLLDAPIEDNGMKVCGQVNRITDNKMSIVKVLRKNTEPDNYKKYCAEQTLVHELMHLALDIADHGTANIEGILYDTHIHQQVELLSRSLIMAKYGLLPEWFSNVNM